MGAPFRLFGLIAIVVGALCGGRMAEATPVGAWRHPDLGGRVAEGAATRAHLWLRGDSGSVLELNRVTGARRVVARDARAMLALDHSLWVLEGVTGAQMIRDLRGPSDPGLGLPSTGVFTDLVSVDGKLGVIGADGLYVRSASGWARTPHVIIAPRGWSAVGADGLGRLYLGMDHGEWGGGLLLLDTGSGAPAFVQDANDGSLCAGALNPACDPVTGIIADAEHEDCVIVATGLAHLMMSEGYILRVCGRTVTELYSDPIPKPTGRQVGTLGSRAFNGLWSTPGGWASVADDHLYRSVGGKVTRTQLPDLKDRDGLFIGEASDDLLVVMDRCCWGRIDLMDQYSVILVPVAAD